MGLAQARRHDTEKKELRRPRFSQPGDGPLRASPAYILLIKLSSYSRDAVADDTQPGAAAPNEPAVTAPAENGR